MNTGSLVSVIVPACLSRKDERSFMLPQLLGAQELSPPLFAFVER